MATFGSKKETQVTERDTASGSSRFSKQDPPAYGSYEDHPFNDVVTTRYWRDVYETAKYEGRHRFDPEYTWTAEEEKRLVRKVRMQSLQKV